MKVVKFQKYGMIYIRKGDIDERYRDTMTSRLRSCYESGTQRVQERPGL